MSTDQAKVAVESRAYPLFRYDPDGGRTPQECFDLGGNPAPEADWPTYTLRFREGASEKSMELPMTFADFAVTESRFRKHFRIAPRETWNDTMVPLAEFLEMDDTERDGNFPFLWSVDRDGQLSRLLVAAPMVTSCEDRRDFWTMLRSIARVGENVPDRAAITAEVRREVASNIAGTLLRMAEAEEGSSAPGAPVPGGGGDGGAAPAETPPGTAGRGGGVSQAVAPWIETEKCSSCDECIQINPQMFAYNDEKKAFIKDPSAGPFSDLVKAAERCTARVIHPGLPADRSGKGTEKLIARATKYN
jgi:pyruvate-ferredoxin/flavodoxin oxidoreductase